MVMMQRKPGLGSLDSLLGDGLESLDITWAEYETAVARYFGLGAVFEDHWGATRGDNVITPQGSFLLGTVVRNIHRNDDVDLDAVAIRDIEKTSVGQAALKADAGVAVHMYARSLDSEHPSVSECHRCWTLQWPGMHLDMLPAIPNPELGQSGILITDKGVRAWLPSDPMGYAAWFRRQMQEAYLSERAKLSKRLQIDDVPEWQVKTTLQQSVQALKRHRDVFFTDHLDDRPASIIITTLAALAYSGGDELFEVLRGVTSRMGDLLQKRDGIWYVSNPVQPAENFADAWLQHPDRADWFFRWLAAAAEDFNSFGVKTGLDHTVPLLEAAFGSRFAKAASLGYGNRLHHAGSSQKLHVATGGALVAPLATATTRKVSSHGFAGGATH